MMKTEVGSSSTSTTSLERPGGGWSPKSAFVRLSRKLSPSRKADQKRSLSTASKCSELERVFRYFDENRDGKISASELQSCMRCVGGELSLAEAEDVVASIDSDGDGLLGLDDFGKLMEVNGEEEKRRDLREAFGMYEMKGLGCITPKSLKTMLCRLGESKTIEECKAIISLFDLNSDGVLSFEEFRLMMN